MWGWSDQARDALSGGHTVASKVDIWHGGTYTYTLDVVGGLVTFDGDRPALANLSATLIDSTGRLSRGDVDDLLDPYECEIAPYRGVRMLAADIGGYTDEMAPLGVFGLTSRQVSDDPGGLTIQIAGQDRAMGYQVPMSSALAIPGGTPIETAVLRLLTAVNATANVLLLKTGFTCGPLLFAPDIDVWAEAQSLAASVGAQLFHDRLGRAVLAPIGPTTTTPVAAYAEGDGLLLSLNRAEDSDTIRNVVIAENPAGTIRVVVSDDDPTSPTYAGGRYGKRPVTIKNQHFGSIKQATQAARAKLAYELGRSETVDFTIVPDSGLDVADVVSVHRPRAGLDRRSLVVAGVEVPLGAEEAMTVHCRKSVLTPSGQVLPLDVSAA